jgi:hypothetical protein
MFGNNSQLNMNISNINIKNMNMNLTGNIKNMNMNLTGNKNNNMKINTNTSLIEQYINKPYKIGLLIPTTSRCRPHWKIIEDTYLYNLTISTFIKTRSIDHTYVFYIGVDKDDPIFTDIVEINKIRNYFPLLNIEFIILEDVKKGHLTKMWNILFEIAYKDNCDYFYQCGDDINFKTNDWIDEAIHNLQNNNNIGLSGPINNNNQILTQCFVSRKHMEIFGWFFPENEIINWHCDDWYNMVYKPNNFFPLYNHYCSNEGGNPRYNINIIIKSILEKLTLEHKSMIKNFAEKTI